MKGQLICRTAIYYDSFSPWAIVMWRSVIPDIMALSILSFTQDEHGIRLEIH